MERVIYKNGNVATDEQMALYEFVAKRVGNALVNACAGSGKTSTILKSVDFVPSDKNILLIAHNKSTADNLDAKIKSEGNDERKLKKIKVYTYHALALRVFTEYMETSHKFDKDLYIEYIKYKNEEDQEKKKESFRNFSEKIINERKYTDYINKNISELSDGVYDNLTPMLRLSYKRNLKKYVDMGRHNLCQSPKDFEKNVQRKYGIKSVANEAEAASKILKWGKSNLRIVDFQDLLWLPYELKYSSNGKYKYDVIFVDEAQDSSPLQIELVKKSLKRGGRFIAVGDVNQAINIWCGSDSKAFNKFTEINPMATTTFGLNICFRCDKNILKEANDKVSEFENKFSVNTTMHNIKPRENCGDGIINRFAKITDIKPDDLCICRNTAPLAKFYKMLIKNGVNAHMIGETKSAGFVQLLIETPGKSMDEVINNLNIRLIETWEAIVNKFNEDPKDAVFDVNIDTLYDEIKSIIYLSDGFNTKEELINYVNNIFVAERELEEKEKNGESVSESQKMKLGVRLSTIHKAKGLESDNVFIVAPSLLPSKLVKNTSQEWERLEEVNLIYVAMTRALHSINYLDERELSPGNGYLYKDDRYKEFLDIKEKIKK